MGVTNVKAGDTYAFWELNTDLTGATVLIYVRTHGADTADSLTTTVTSEATGLVRAVVGSLDAGWYDVEAIVTQGGVNTRYPDKGFESLFVNEALS